MDNNYTERIKAHIGKAPEGRLDFFDLTREDSIKLIREKLKDNFSCNLWTFEWTNAEIKEADKALTEAGIVHVFDEITDAINCFKSETDMQNFYNNLRKQVSEEDLEFMRKHKYNTPLIIWYD